MDKGITYRQSADGVQPSTATGWFIEVIVQTSNSGDFGSVSISRVGSGDSHSLEFEDGEWVFDKEYQSQAEMDEEFPNGSNYTITANGGSLGPMVQIFTLGSANYPNIPFLTGVDLTRVQSIDAESNFVIHWNDPGSFGDGVFLELEERLTENYVGEFEFYDAPLPEEVLIPADTLEDGRAYVGYLGFENEVEVSGAGGFGTEGYILHFSELNFEIQTVLSSSLEAIVGAWQFGDGASNASGVLVFQADGVYYHIQDIPDGDPDMFDGMERGTYSWDQNSGQLTPTVQIDTNGEIGLSHPLGSFTVSVNGDFLTIADGDGPGVLNRVAYDSNSLIEGGWSICDSGELNAGVLIFLDNGIYFHAESNGGDEGMERGTYSLNSGTGVLTATQEVDTNREIGLSDPGNGTFVVDFPSWRVMEIFDGEQFFLKRVNSPSGEAVEAIVGAWQFGDGAPDNSGVLVFQSNGVYFHAEDKVIAPGEFDGMERGTYTWIEETGKLLRTVEVDTNGESGLSHPFSGDFIAIDGDTMTITDPGVPNEDPTILQRVVYNPAARIEGGWRIIDNSGSNTGVFVFLNNGTYFHAEVEVGLTGVERGTYTWNQETGLLTSTQSLDTNGESGLSDPLNGTDVATFPTPRVMEIFDGERNYLHRVTNAAVMPDWRLNKGRNFNQLADDTMPTTPIFWDVYSQVFTRNPIDAAKVTLSGGGISGSIELSVSEEDDPGEWTYDKDYENETFLDAEFPDNQVYTITVSGGELGTVSQEINIDAKDFPNVPYLTGTFFSDIQSLDPTEETLVVWNTPINETFVELAVSSLPGEDGDELFVESFPGGGATQSTLPVAAIPAGTQAYGYLEFSKFLSDTDGKGGFRVSGFTSRQSSTQDFPINAKSTIQLVSSAAEDAGLSEEDTEPDAIPFNDGVENILKYAFNMNLAGADVSTLESGSGNSGLPVFSLGESASAQASAARANADDLSTEFKVEYIRRVGSGLTYIPKVSTTLQNGSFTEMTGTETVSPIGTDGKFERVILSQPYDPAVTPKTFGRVEVSGL